MKVADDHPQYQDFRPWLDFPLAAWLAGAAPFSASGPTMFFCFHKISYPVAEAEVKTLPSR